MQEMFEQSKVRRALLPGDTETDRTGDHTGRCGHRTGKYYNISYDGRQLWVSDDLACDSDCCYGNHIYAYLLQGLHAYRNADHTRDPSLLWEACGVYCRCGYFFILLFLYYGKYHRSRSRYESDHRNKLEDRIDRYDRDHACLLFYQGSLYKSREADNNMHFWNDRMLLCDSGFCRRT